MLDASLPSPELLRPLALGAIVRLPDGTLAEVTHSTHAEVAVVHAYLFSSGRPGAGPWLYERYQVELATESERGEYRRACRGAAWRARDARVTQPLPANWRQSYVSTGPQHPAPSAAMREESRMVTQQLKVLDGEVES